MLAYISRLRAYFVRDPNKLGRMAKASGENLRSPTVIADDLIIDGSLVSSGDIYLLGHVKGDVTCGNVFFGERGAVDGAIHVRGQSDAANNQMTGAANVHFT